MEKIERLTCTQCGAVKEQYSSIEYSQGRRVCTDCKKSNKASDDRAYDRYIETRWMHSDTDNLLP